MKSKIGFTAVLIFVVMLGINFMSETSNATLYSAENAKAQIIGYAPWAGAFIEAKQNGVVVATAYADVNKFFRLTGLQFGAAYDITATYNDCSATKKGVVCNNTVIDFNGVPIKCW